MRILVNTMFMGDVEDPEIYAAEPILAFEKTEKGQWLHEHSYRQMEYNILPDQATYGYKIGIFAWLNERDLTYYNLKWS